MVRDSSLYLQCLFLAGLMLAGLPSAWATTKAHTCPSVKDCVGEFLLRKDLPAGMTNTFSVKSASDSSGLVVAVGQSVTRGDQAYMFSSLYKAKSGVVLVLRKDVVGYRVLARSARFDLPPLPDDYYSSKRRSVDVTGVALKGVDRFSVQFYSDDGGFQNMWIEYEFARRGGRWVLAGRDREIVAVVAVVESLPVGSGNMEPFLTTVQKDSVNLLTGRRIAYRYRFDPVTLRSHVFARPQSTRMSAQVLLAKFNPVDTVDGDEAKFVTGCTLNWTGKNAGKFHVVKVCQ